jgi:hypothetical protein
MRKGSLLSVAAVLAAFDAIGPVAAATPAMEQAFLAAYKAAYTARDKNGIAALVHTQGANPVVLDFYLSLLTSDLGAGEVTVALQPLNSDDIADAARAMPGPGGTLVRLAPTPYKKLVVTVATGTGNNRSTSTTTVYVADEGDKLRIAAPVEVK